MATDDGDHHPAVEAFVSGDSDELPDLGEPPGDEWDPLLDGERIRVESDDSGREEPPVPTATDGDHHPAVEAFVSGDPDELPDLGDPPGDERDPLLDGEYVSAENEEEW